MKLNASVSCAAGISKEPHSVMSGAVLVYSVTVRGPQLADDATKNTKRTTDKEFCRVDKKDFTELEIELTRTYL